MGERNGNCSMSVINGLLLLLDSNNDKACKDLNEVDWVFCMDYDGGRMSLIACICAGVCL